MSNRDPLLVQVGRRIRAIREEKGISQEALAEESGLHRTYIGGVERGLRNATLKSLERIAKALGVKLADFLESEES